ncbi:MAG: S-layer homology domain-containing protein [Butyricicoccus sp.]
MKRLAAGLCALGLLSGAAGAVVSEMTPPPPEDNSVVTAPAIDYTNSADILYTLGLFQGVGFDAQGKPLYDLGARCTRAEAAVMLMRLLGLEKEAQTAPAGPFTDLQDWQKPAVNLLYQKGMISGASADKFEPEAPCTVEMYTTFMLRALGYSDKKGDFRFESAPVFGMQIGLLDNFSCDIGDFRRDDAVQMSRMALELHPKGAKETLIAQLVADGIVDSDKAGLILGETKQIAEVQNKAAAAIPYAADVFASLIDRETKSTMSLRGSLVDQGRQAVLHGMLSVAMGDGYSVSQKVSIVRDSSGISISPLGNRNYRDDQVAAMLRETNLLSLAMSVVPARSLLGQIQVYGNTVTLPLAAGTAKLKFEEDGTLAERTLNMNLHNVSYHVTAKTTKSGKGIELFVPGNYWQFIKISHIA